MAGSRDKEEGEQKEKLFEKWVELGPACHRLSGLHCVSSFPPH